MGVGSYTVGCLEVAPASPSWKPLGEQSRPWWKTMAWAPANCKTGRGLKSDLFWWLPQASDHEPSHMEMHVDLYWSYLWVSSFTTQYTHPYRDQYNPSISHPVLLCSISFLKKKNNWSWPFKSISRPTYRPQPTDWKILVQSALFYQGPKKGPDIAGPGLAHRIVQPPKERVRLTPPVFQLP